MLNLRLNHKIVSISEKEIVFDNIVKQELPTILSSMSVLKHSWNNVHDLIDLGFEPRLLEALIRQNVVEIGYNGITLSSYSMINYHIYFQKIMQRMSIKYSSLLIML